MNQLITMMAQYNYPYLSKIKFYKYEKNIKLQNYSINAFYDINIHYLSTYKIGYSNNTIYIIPIRLLATMYNFIDFNKNIIITINNQYIHIKRIINKITNSLCFTYNTFINNFTLFNCVINRNNEYFNTDKQLQELIPLIHKIEPFIILN